MALPFQVVCGSSGAPNTLIVSLLFGSPFPDQQKLDLVEALGNDLARLGTEGGLAGAHIPPTASNLILRSAIVAPHSATWEFEQVAVADEARLILENLSYHVHRHVTPVQQLLITASTQGLCNAASTAPGRNPAVPFGVVIEADQSDVVIEIEFANALNVLLQHRLIEAWNSWLFIAGVGGFEPAGPTRRKVTAYPSDDPDFAHQWVTMHMEDVSFCEEAFDAFINILCKFHATGAPILDVAIS